MSESYMTMKFAAALVEIMDGMRDHDIKGETGLPDDECELIARARKDAQNMLNYSGLNSMRVLRDAYQD